MRPVAVFCVFLAGVTLLPLQVIAGPVAPVVITVVETSDFHGALEPKNPNEKNERAVGGIDIIAAYFQALRQASPESLILLDGGDLYQGTLLSAANEGKAVIEFYNDLGYDAACVGNHDFDFGPVGYQTIPILPEDDPLGVIKERISEAQFPFLAANIYDRVSGKPVRWKNLKGYTIIKRRGISIGVIGLTSVDTALTTHPANVRTLEFRPLLPALRRLLPKVRAKGATVIIVLAHVGARRDEITGEVSGPLADLANALQPGEVDLIAGGHLHTPIATRVHGIPIIEAAANGSAFAEALLPINAATGRVIQEQVVLHDNTVCYRTDPQGGPPVFAGQRLAPVEQFANKLKMFRRSITHLEDIRLGLASKALQNRTPLDSPVGNLVTDAMRAWDRSIDVAMFNSGGLRTSIPEGVITFGRIYEVVPFDNNLVLLSLTGAQIREILEHGLSAPYGVMEVSGLRVVVDSDAPPGKRCLSILTETGEALNYQKLYTVATNEFVVSGGDGYFTFSHGKDVRNTHTLIRELVASYIKKKGMVNPAEEQRYTPSQKKSEKLSP